MRFMIHDDELPMSYKAMWYMCLWVHHVAAYSIGPRAVENYMILVGPHAGAYYCLCAHFVVKHEDVTY